MSVDLNSKELKYSESDFFNPENKLKFITEKYVNYTHRSIQQILNVFKKIGDIEKNLCKDIAFFTLDEFKLLFEENKWLSIGVIENKQSLVREYMRWYRKHGYENWEECQIRDTIDQIEYKDLSSDVIYESEWFRSQEELENEIGLIFESYDGIDDHELDLGITLIYLAWFDVDSDEAILLRKNHVSKTLDQIYLPASERFIEIDSKPMEFIRDYLSSEGYNVTARGNNTVFREYKSSGYLLRTVRREKITENNLRATLSVISDQYEESGKARRFKYDRIQKSGIYAKLIKYEKRNGELTTRDVDVFEGLFRESYKQSISGMAKFYNALKDYQKYKEYYFNTNNS